MWDWNMIFYIALGVLIGSSITYMLKLDRFNHTVLKTQVLDNYHYRFLSKITPVLNSKEVWTKNEIKEKIHESANATFFEEFHK